MAGEAHITVLGAGRIGEALIGGLLAAGWRTPDRIVAADRRAERLKEVSERFGVRTESDNARAVHGADVIVIAVKPQDIDELLADVSEVLHPDQTVISVAAGIRTSAIESRLDADVPVVRVMPNAPVTVREGITGIAPGSHSDSSHVELAEELLGHVGRTVRVQETALDAVTAVSGSGPAYFALLAESMIEAGILLGLARDVSTDLVIQTMFGTAKLLRDEGLHPVELRESVTSPGGTTIAAIQELEQAGVRAAILNAIQAAHRRGRELADDG